LLLTAIGLSPGGSGYVTRIQNMKLVTTNFNFGWLNEKHVVATWNLGNHLSICFKAQGNQEKPVSRWPVVGPSEYGLLANSPASKVKKKKQQVDVISLHSEHRHVSATHVAIFSAVRTRIQPELISIIFNYICILFSLP